MLASLVNNNSFFSDVHMDNIINMICQIHYLHLEIYFIQQKHHINFRHLC